MLTPRLYQQEATDKIMAYIRKSSLPCCITAPMGSGKSVIVSMVAAELRIITDKKVLALAPSKELVKQNFNKYNHIGKASLFCAGLKQKNITGEVIFASPQSLKNNLKSLKDIAFSAIIVDECHKTTPSIINIIEEVKKNNPNIRVVGLTATPYRMGTGFIYGAHYINGVEKEAVKPYYAMCVYDIKANDLIEQGFLSPPLPLPKLTSIYEGLKCKLKSGVFDNADIKAYFEDQHEKTFDICVDLANRIEGCKGILVFCTTLKHAKSVVHLLEYLLNEKIGYIDGQTHTAERDRTIKQFCNQELRVIVNKDVLTTGFDAPHTDCVAIMRPTESAGLLIQMIGRAMRISLDKEGFYVLDYAENIERHKLQENLFEPKIKIPKKGKGSEGVEVECPECHKISQFMLKPEYKGLKLNRNGHVLDLAGDLIKPLKVGHFGRTCKNLVPIKPFPKSVDDYKECNHFFVYKKCSCGQKNDITVRFCSACDKELIDPDVKLTDTASLIKHKIEPEERFRLVEPPRFVRTWTNPVGLNLMLYSFKLENGKTVTRWYKTRQDMDNIKSVAVKGDKVIKTFI